MGDVADILGLAKGNDNSEASRILADKPKQQQPHKTRKPKGMSREVFGLLGTDGLNSSMQTSAQTVSTPAFKTKRLSALKGKWVWAPFNASASASLSSVSAPLTTSDTSSSTVSGSFLHHWVKADIQYLEYPYAKFNVSLDRVIYSDDEYDLLLQSNDWTRSETDALFQLCHQYDLRWPIIVDRYTLQPCRPSEELQHRYYSVVKILAHSRSSGGSSGGNAKHVESSSVFDVDQERARRFQLELLFRR